MQKKIITILLIILILGISGKYYFVQQDIKLTDVLSSISTKIQEVPLFYKSLDSYDKVLPYADTTLKIVHFEGKKGIVQDNGKVIIPIVYDSIEKVGNYYSIANTDKDGNRQSALIDLNAKIVFPPQKGTVSYCDKMYIYDHYDRYTFYSNNLDFLFEVQSEIRPIFSSHFICVKQQGKNVLINYLGERLINDDYEQLGVANTRGITLNSGKGLVVPILKNSKWGIVSLKNEYFIPCEYDDINVVDFYETKQFWFKKGDKWGKLDINNNIVVPFKYAAIPNIVGKNFVVVEYNNEPLMKKNINLYDELSLQKIINDMVQKEKNVVIEKKNKEYLAKINANKNNPVKFVCEDRYKCSLKDGALTVSMGTAGAFSTAEANRYYTKGKYYFEAEIIFINPEMKRVLMFEDIGIMYKSPDAIFCTTNTNNKDCSAYGLNFPRDIKSTIKSGDVIGFAVDFDNAKIYNSLNGEWIIGNPTTGTSPYLFDSGKGKAYTVFANATRDTDWKFNFGVNAFRYSIPKGFRAYDTKLK